jgi:subtilisin family serine protease
MIKVTALTLGVALASVATAEPERVYAADSDESKPSARVIVKYKDGVATAQGMGGPGGTKVFNVDDVDRDAFVEQLRNRPEVDDVALDVMTSHPPMPKPKVKVPLVNGASYQPDNAPGDPGFIEQAYWNAPTEQYMGVQDILKAYLDTPREANIRIGILDSGFYETPELIWSEGYNLTDIGLSEIGPDFYENLVAPDCDVPHGNGVAGIVGATANNGLAIAGITNAELVAGRVLECNSGSLFDAATGIRWMAGDRAIANVPAISAPVDVINLSLGAQTDCPFYMQEAIDYATDRGILVVAAAGNDEIDAERYSPANCDNVLTVGALNRFGDKADFSNFGSTVDVAAMGVQVASLDEAGELTQWYGTSFAAPIVAGIGGLIKQANPALTAEQIADHIVANARAPMSEDGQVGGIADAAKALSAVGAELDASRPNIRPALNGVNRCNEEAYTRNEPAGVDFRSLYEVDASDITRDQETEFYAIFKTDASGSKQLVELTSDAVFILGDVDLEEDQAWFDVCDSEGENCRFEQNLPL